MGFISSIPIILKSLFFVGGGSNMALEVGQVACPNTIFFFIMAFFKTFIHESHSSKIMDVKKKDASLRL